MMNLSRPEGKNCLSLGCGLGRFLRDYTDLGAFVAVGLDINKENLKQCKSIGAELVQGDVENLPLKNDAFNIVDCEATMEHIANPLKAMREINRILDKQLGYSFVTWHVYNWLKLSSRTVRKRLVLHVRDLFLNITGLGKMCAALGDRKIRRSKLLKILFYSYGTYRNGGYSYPVIQNIYAGASMRIDLLKTYNHVVFVTSKIIKNKV